MSYYKEPLLYIAEFSHVLDEGEVLVAYNQQDLEYEEEKYEEKIEKALKKNGVKAVYFYYSLVPKVFSNAELTEEEIEEIIKWDIDFEDCYPNVEE